MHTHTHTVTSSQYPAVSESGGAVKFSVFIFPLSVSVCNFLMGMCTFLMFVRTYFNVFTFFNVSKQNPIASHTSRPPVVHTQTHTCKQVRQIIKSHKN